MGVFVVRIVGTGNRLIISRNIPKRVRRVMDLIARHANESVAN